MQKKKDNLILLLEEDAKLKNGKWRYLNSHPLIVDVHLLFLFVCCRQWQGKTEQCDFNGGNKTLHAIEDSANLDKSKLQIWNFQPLIFNCVLYSYSTDSDRAKPISETSTGGNQTLHAEEDAAHVEKS